MKRQLLAILSVLCAAINTAAQSKPSQSGSAQALIIDVYLHAHTLSMYGTPPPSICTNDQEILFPGWDQRKRSDMRMRSLVLGGSRQQHQTMNSNVRSSTS
jgi:hypothetical protein